MYNAEKTGITIAELRMEKGLKQNRLSEILNMSPSNLSNYEHGVYEPDLGTLCILADFFHVTTDYILGRTYYRCPPETLRNYLTPDYTVCGIVNILLTMDADSLDAIVKYVNYLKANPNILNYR